MSYLITPGSTRAGAGRLSDAGNAEAYSLAEKLVDVEHPRIIVSPHFPCMQTGAVLKRALAGKTTVLPDLELTTRDVISQHNGRTKVQQETVRIPAENLGGEVEKALSSYNPDIAVFSPEYVRALLDMKGVPFNEDPCTAWNMTINDGEVQVEGSTFSSQHIISPFLCLPPPR